LPAALPVVVFAGAAVAPAFALAGGGEVDPAAGGAAAGAVFDAPVVATGAALAGAGEVDEAGGFAAEVAVVPPRPVT